MTCSSSDARRWVAAVVVLLAPAAARGLINPNFTPIHLTVQSKLIVLATAPRGKAGQTVVLKIAEALKGKAPANFTISLAYAPKAHAEAARALLAESSGRKLLVFAGKYDKDELAYVHVSGKWMQLGKGDDGWRLIGIDTHMLGTWNGATDMLTRCVRYVIAERGGADVPVNSGTEWRKIVKVAALKARPRSALAVDLAGDGRSCLFVASGGGDVLLRHDAKKGSLADITGKVKLGSRSQASAWGDFNGDGRADLASFDGKALTIWTQAADGTFSSAPARLAPAKPGGRPFALPADCPALTAVGQGRLTALVVGGAATPVLLVPDGKGGFAAAALPAAGKIAAKWGKPGWAIAADFTGDAVADIIVPFEKGGMLYAGKSGGGFKPPTSCGVTRTAGEGSAAEGDFDADGFLDVLAAGAEGVKVFHNLRNGSFAETMLLSGEISYKAQPFASFCGVGDFNNDSHQDIFITYSGDTPPLVYFNRGFRSFGEAPDLEMPLAENPDLAGGQVAALLADLDHNGGEDLVLVTVKGLVYCAYNDLGEGDALGIRARLGRGAPCPGPVSVTAYAGKRCLGTRAVSAAGPPAFFGLASAGKYRLTWQFPGGAKQSINVTVEDAPVDVLLKAPGKSPPAR